MSLLFDMVLNLLAHCELFPLSLLTTAYVTANLVKQGNYAELGKPIKHRSVGCDWCTAWDMSSWPLLTLIVVTIETIKFSRIFRRGILLYIYLFIVLMGKRHDYCINCCC